MNGQYKKVNNTTEITILTWQIITIEDFYYRLPIFQQIEQI